MINMLNTRRNLEAAVHASGLDDFGESDGSRTTAETGYSSLDMAAQTSQYPSIVPDDLLQQGQDPGLTAEMDDWGFQGVDMALFDSLMKGVDDYEDE